MVEVIPVSDPNSATMAQRIMQYQAVIQLAGQAPQIYNLPELHRQMIEVLGVKNADKLIPTKDDQTPRDPISENMAFLKGEPTKAFIYQDHEAHITAHQSFMQDPIMAATIGQNPMAQQMQAAIMAHIAEHLAFNYRKKVEEEIGVPLPPPNEKMPEDVEVQLSRLVAQGSAQLLQKNNAQQQQQQAQQAAQDPLIQMQQQELQIKAKEVAIKEQKMQNDFQAKQTELAIKEAELDLKSQPTEDPSAVVEKHIQEMIQRDEVHQQKIAQAQQQQAQQAQQAQQQMAMQAQQKPEPNQ
jgi:hypothetical protein